CSPRSVSPAPGCDACATVDRAIQLARTAAFFSADETPLTSRSVRFLSGEHFPPKIRNTAAGALFGIENTNRGCALGESPSLDARTPRARSLLAEPKGLKCQDASSLDPDAVSGCTSGIATLPGGVPIFKNGRLAGGVGVALLGAMVPPDPVAA